MSNQALNRDEADIISIEKTPLYIGLGVVIKGSIEFTGDLDQRLIVLGEVHGDITTNGILQVAKGGVVRPSKLVQCSQIVVAGDIHGEDVTMKADVLTLMSSAVVRVGALQLPAGGLEQARGSVLSAKLDMSDIPVFASAITAPKPTGARVMLVPAAEASSATAAPLPSDDGTAARLLAESKLLAPVNASNSSFDDDNEDKKEPFYTSSNPA